MRTDDPRLQRFVADGQALFVPDAAALADLVAIGILDERPIGTGRLLAQYAALAASVPGLHVALGAVVEPEKPWWVYHAAVRGDLAQRIKVESQRCTQCGTTMLTGNHRDFSLYIGTDDPMATLEAHWDDPLATCIGCNASLPRPAVWAAHSPSVR